MSKTYIPSVGTLAWNVCQYFRRLAGEELSSKDIGIKWGVESGNVRHQLKLSVEAGLLHLDGTIYSAGDNIDLVEASAQPFLGSISPRSAQGRTSEIDIESIDFEDNVRPPSDRHVAPVTDRWEAKLRTMKEGQSFAVSREHRHSLQTAITRLRKLNGPLTFTSRKRADEIRVFCVKAEEKTQ